jgi:TP901-1 family phage major tail protein
MPAGKGSSFLLKDNSTGTPATIGGLRSVDITTKDSNAFISSGNDKARDLLQGGGVRSMTISASGVFTDSSTENILRGFAFDGAIQNYDLVFSDGSKIAGAFLITSYERAGEFNGEETYSVTLESSNTITYTNA